MKSLMLILMFAIPVLSYSQASVNWIQYTRGVSIAVDNSNNVFTVDYDYNPAGDIYITRRNSSGTSLWSVSYDQTDNTKWEKAIWVETDNLGNSIVAGNLMSGYSSPVNAASILMKFDPNGNLLWRNIYENSFDGSYTKKCIVDASNNIYVLGMGNSAQYGYVTKVKKFAPDGSTLWTYFNGGGIGAPLNFKFTADNCIVIAGRSVFGSVNGFAKLDLNGNPIWSIAGLNSNTIGDIAGDAFGNSYIVSAEYVAINQRTMIKKINPSGTEIWVRYFTLAAQRIELGNDNLPVAVGYVNQGGFGTAAVKVDANGNQVWLNPDADGSYNLLLHAQLKMDPQNNIYLAAGTMTEMAICKVNSNGTSGWTLTMPGSYANGFDFGTENSVYVVGGNTAKIIQGVSPLPCPVPQGLSSSEVTKTSAKLSWGAVSGAQKYEIIYQNAMSISAKKAWTYIRVPGSQNYAVLTGLKCNTPYNWRVRTICDTTAPVVNLSYSASQRFTTLSCNSDEQSISEESDELETSVPSEFYLGTNYPNPFNPETRIKFGLSKHADVSITVFNSLGQRIATLENSFMTKGNYSVTWNGTNDNGELQSSGVYFCRMSAGDFVQVRKMVLNR